MSQKSRVEKLEALIKPLGFWWERVPFIERLSAWREAIESGLHLDFTTGKPVTLETLKEIDAARADRIMEVLSYECADETS